MLVEKEKGAGFGDYNVITIVLYIRLNFYSTSNLLNLNYL